MAHGCFFAGWAPYHPRRETLPDIPGRFAATAKAFRDWARSLAL